MLHLEKLALIENKPMSDRTKLDYDYAMHNYNRVLQELRQVNKLERF